MFPILREDYVFSTVTNCTSAATDAARAGPDGETSLSIAIGVGAVSVDRLQPVFGTQDEDRPLGVAELVVGVRQSKAAHAPRGPAALSRAYNIRAGAELPSL
jgi:hypothetical protein